jgi:hypothetical protein
MDELSAMGPNENLDEARVEAFLAPLAELSPASRANGRRRARRRVVRIAVVVAVVAGLGAGLAVAAEQDQPTATVIDTKGNVTVVPLIPVAPPRECANPACSKLRDRQPDKSAATAPRHP